MHSALRSYQSSASHIFLLNFYHYFTFFLPRPLIHLISFSFLNTSFYFRFSVSFSLFFFISSLLFLFITSYSFPKFFPVFYSSSFSYAHAFAILNFFLSFNIAHSTQLRISFHHRCKVGKPLLSFQLTNQTHSHSDSKALTPSVSVQCRSQNPLHLSVIFLSFPSIRHVIHFLYFYDTFGIILAFSSLALSLFLCSTSSRIPVRSPPAQPPYSEITELGR